MSPEDARHGTTAGHYAHRRAGEDACAPCIAAKTRYEKIRTVYGNRMVPAIGTRRRIRSLKAMGHSGADIAARLGVTYQAVHRLEHGTSEKVFAATDRNVRRVFEEMCMTLPTGYHRTRIRNTSARRGYVPPLAYDDMDDPAENPTGIPTPTRKEAAELTVADWELLQRNGYTRRAAAEYMGISKKRLEKAIERTSRRLAEAS